MKTTHDTHLAITTNYPPVYCSLHHAQCSKGNQENEFYILQGIIAAWLPAPGSIEPTTEEEIEAFNRALKSIPAKDVVMLKHGIYYTINRIQINSDTYHIDGFRSVQVFIHVRENKTKCYAMTVGDTVHVKLFGMTQAARSILEDLTEGNQYDVTRYHTDDIKVDYTSMLEEFGPKDKTVMEYKCELIRRGAVS